MLGAAQMAALPEGEPAFTVTMYGITGGETAVEGARAADTIGALTLEFCAAKADGTLPEWIDASTLETLPPNYRPDAWLPPQVVWEVRGAMLSASPVFRAAADLVDENGKGLALRFPRFLRARDDKAPTDATTSAQLADLFLAQQSAVAAAAAAPREPPPPPGPIER